MFSLAGFRSEVWRYAAVSRNFDWRTCQHVTLLLYHFISSADSASARNIPRSMQLLFSCQLRHQDLPYTTSHMCAPLTRLHLPCWTPQVHATASLLSAPPPGGNRLGPDGPALEWRGCMAGQLPGTVGAVLCHKLKRTGVSCDASGPQEVAQEMPGLKLCQPRPCLVWLHRVWYLVCLTSSH